ncbi:MAG: tRNA lysidine(34) synthetase TilS [bacterium]|nr:tRNA lysidine(34) synthetase TilS [bacterium]
MKTSILPTAFAVGLSGGADSTALLYRCLELPGKTIVAVHFNHGFDDENGDDAEAYCRDLCQRLKVPLFVGRCTIEWDHKTTKEVFARDQRFAFFKHALQTQGLTALLLAHHAGDRSENLILRLARGSGLEGLVSFKDKTPFPGWPQATIYRPLLDETHEEQTAWLEARGETWIEDTSNVDTTIPRNAIRHHLRTVLPHFVAGANLAGDILEEENTYLNHCVDAAITRLRPNTLECAPETNLVLLRRALRRWLPESLSYAQLQALAQLPIDASYNLSRSVRILRQSPTTWKRIEHLPLARPPEILIETTGAYTFGPWTIRVGETPTSQTRHTVTLPLPLLVRARQPGDKISPSGFKGSRKVQDVLTDLHIPATERNAYPLFFHPETNRLLYVPGLRPAPTNTTPTITLHLDKPTP